MTANSITTSCVKKHCDLSPKSRALIIFFLLAISKLFWLLQQRFENYNGKTLSIVTDVSIIDIDFHNFIFLERNF